MMSGGKCRSTEEKSRSTVEGECRSKNECHCRSKRCFFLCGLSDLNVQDLKRAMFVPCCFWYCKAPERQEKEIYQFFACNEKPRLNLTK